MKFIYCFMLPEWFPLPIEFEWDEGNSYKNWHKHGVEREEAEQVFAKKPLITPDPRHSAREDRFYAVGLTEEQRMLSIAFTLRKQRIRIITARTSSRKERKMYEAYKEEA